jgi:hypothetical protein
MNDKTHFFCHTSSTAAILKSLLCLSTLFGLLCYCCPALNTCTNWTHICHLNAKTLIKYRNLLSELPAYQQRHIKCIKLHVINSPTCFAKCSPPTRRQHKWIFTGKKLTSQNLYIQC